MARRRRSVGEGRTSHSGVSSGLQSSAVGPILGGHQANNKIMAPTLPNEQVQAFLRHHYRARNWTFGENHFLVSSYSSFKNGSSGENRVKKFSGEVGIKCNQSCTVALVFCTKLYKNTPFRRPSCQAREEKRKFSPTATSLRRRRQRSRT